MVRVLGLLLATVALATMLTLPAEACTKPRNPRINIWIVISGNQVRIIIHNFMTFPAGPSQFCACSFRNVPSLSSVQSAQLFRAGTSIPVPGFSFNPNSVTGQSFGAIAGGSWSGFLAAISAQVPQGLPVDLVFDGTLKPGASFASLSAEIRQAGGIVGTDEGTANGTLTGDHLVISVAESVGQTQAQTPDGNIGAMDADSNSIELTLVDTQDGLTSVEVLDTEGAIVRVPEFTIGTKEPVDVNIEMVGDDHRASFHIRACNGFGACAVFGSLAMRMVVPEGEGILTEEIPHLEPGLNRLHLKNGKPGIRMVAAWVNGSRMSVRPLLGHQELDFDLSLAMGGTDDSLLLSTRGPAGSSALVVLTNGY